MKYKPECNFQCQLSLRGDSIPSHALLLTGIQRFQRAGVQDHDVGTLGLLIALKSNTSSVHLQEFNCASL